MFPHKVRVLLNESADYMVNIDKQSCHKPVENAGSKYVIVTP